MDLYRREFGGVVVCCLFASCCQTYLLKFLFQICAYSRSNVNLKQGNAIQQTANFPMNLRVASKQTSSQNQMRLFCKCKHR